MILVVPKSTRAEALIVVLVVVALLGGVFALKPSWIPGASRRAAKSTDATAAVEKSVIAQGAVAAASAVKIGEANGMAPESPARSFIAREVPHLVSLLPQPDPAALLAAERRRVAVMEGRLEEARTLYETSSKEAARLQKERDAAFAARRAADLALEKAAAAEHQKTMMLWGAGLIALLFLGGWIYSKVYSISPNLLGNMVADIRAGVPGVQAIDTYLAPRFHRRVRNASKLATEPSDTP